jgi:hypothetical protein
MPKISKVSAVTEHVRAVPDYHQSMIELAEHVQAILENPYTPTVLYNPVLQFVTDGIHVKAGEGESLLERWLRLPDTIEAVVRWTREADDRSAEGGAK